MTATDRVVDSIDPQGEDDLMMVCGRAPHVIPPVPGSPGLTADMPLGQIASGPGAATVAQVMSAQR